MKRPSPVIRFSNVFLCVVGVACMILALAMEHVTLVHREEYGPTLLTALGLAGAADACLAVVAWRGGRGWRRAAIVGMLPTVYVVGEFARRAPYVF